MLGHLDCRAVNDQLVKNHDDGNDADNLERIVDGKDTLTRMQTKKRTSFHCNFLIIQNLYQISIIRNINDKLIKDSRVPGLFVSALGSDAVPDVDLDDDGLVVVQAPGEPGGAPEEPAKS